jgi:hypothetical protein
LEPILGFHNVDGKRTVDPTLEQVANGRLVIDHKDANSGLGAARRGRGGW